MVALETAALIASATPGTHLLGIVVQGLIIAFVVSAAVSIGAEAGQLASAFWESVKGANGDPKKIDAAALDFARLVIFILRTIAEFVAGGVLAKISMKGMKIVGAERPMVREGQEVRVPRDRLQITSAKNNSIWELKVKASLPDGAKFELVDAWTTLDSHGRPESGPTLTINKRVNRDVRIQVYQGNQQASLTNLALDESLAAFQRDFGHPPDSLPGVLGWENAGNFQRAYVDALDNGLNHEAACQAAIRQTSFGRSRLERGYGNFKISADRFMELNLDRDKGPRNTKMYGMRNVPANIKISAKRNK